MLITLPAGKHQLCVGRHRIYDREALNKLFKGFDVRAYEFWIKPYAKIKHCWRPSKMREILKHTENTECEWLGNVSVAVKNVKSST